MNRLLKTGMLAFMLLLGGSLWAAEKTIASIELHHRLASDIIEQVQAFMPPGTTARAYNNLIILKASYREVEEIRTLIETLDTPLQRLKITVLNSDRTLSYSELLQVSTDVRISNRGVYGGASVEGRSDRLRSNSNQTYQAQGLAGNPIYISMGRSIPQQDRYLVFLPYGGVGVQTDTYYLNVNSGFQAVARVQSNGLAIVDIHPVFSQFVGHHGEYEQTEIATQISGPVGSWIKLGEIDDETSIENRGTTRSYKDSEKQQTVYLRVDQLN